MSVWRAEAGAKRADRLTDVLAAGFAELKLKNGPPAASRTASCGRGEPPLLLRTPQIGVFYGNADEATRYNGIVNDLMLIGRWTSFMSTGVGFQYAYNTGYGGRFVSLRYFPRKVAVKDIPSGFPAELNVGLSSRKQIRDAIETAHVTSLDAFYYGVFGLVKRVIEAIRLQEISQGGAQLLNMTDWSVVQQLETLVQRAANQVEEMSTRVGICVVQQLSAILRGSGGYDFVVPDGVVLSQTNLEEIAFIKLVKYLQTTFVEIGARYEAGESENLSVYEDLEFAWRDGRHPAELEWRTTGIEAARARFDRRARRFFHPFTSNGTATRGLEVTNPNNMFDASVVQRVRAQHPESVPPLHVEMAARLFFYVVHGAASTEPPHSGLYRANGELYPRPNVNDVYSSPRAKSAKVAGDEIMRPDRPAPLTEDAVVFLRRFIASDAAVKKRRAYGRSELGLFPLEYERAATELYQQMVQRALKGMRYVGVGGCAPTYDMSWLELDLNPTQKEGTLAGAIEDYERDSDEERD